MSTNFVDSAQSRLERSLVSSSVNESDSNLYITHMILITYKRRLRGSPALEIDPCACKRQKREGCKKLVATRGVHPARVLYAMVLKMLTSSSIPKTQP